MCVSTGGGVVERGLGRYLWLGSCAHAYKYVRETSKLSLEDNVCLAGAAEEDHVCGRSMGITRRSVNNVGAHRMQGTTGWQADAPG